MFILSYQGPKFTNVTVVKVADKEQGEAYTATLPDDGTGVDVYVNNAEDLKLERSALNILYNALAETPVKKFDNQTVACTRLFTLLGHVAKDWSPSAVQQPKEKEPEATDTTPAGFPAPSLESPEGETTTADPEATAIAAAYEKEADMAAKKKDKAKKTPKAKTPKAAKEKKVSNGLPRSGSKKAELLRLLQRASGATMAEMLAATGWKACLGTAKAVATAAKLKFRHEKGEGNKASRWYAE